MPHEPDETSSAYPWKSGAQGAAPYSLPPAGAGPASLTFHETGVQLERELLLDDLPLGASSWEPGRRHRTPWLVISLLVLVAGALGLLFHLEQRKGWEASIAGLRGEMESRAREATLREQGLERAVSDKEKLLGERRSESQSLLGITERTLTELKGSLEEVRSLRHDNKQLELEVQNLRQARPRSDRGPSMRLPSWLRAAIEATATPEG